MTSSPGPIYLFADSQLLFWEDNGTRWLDSVIQSVADRGSVRAAYLGASNGDDPQFYQIFKDAMENGGVQDCRLVPAPFTAEGKKSIERADIIMLAGGNIERGWNAFQSAGVPELLVARHNSGASLMGVSAGAVQLGLLGWKAEGPTPENLFETLRLIPFVIGVHEENEDWMTLKKIISLRNDYIQGIGIPFGGGMIYRPDRTLEPIRRPLLEISKAGPQFCEGLLFPKT